MIAGPLTAVHDLKRRDAAGGTLQRFGTKWIPDRPKKRITTRPRAPWPPIRLRRYSLSGAPSGGPACSLRARESHTAKAIATAAASPNQVMAYCMWSSLR